MFSTPHVLTPGHRYVSRANPRDNTRHVILTTASMRPMDFAGQLNVSLANGWGIVRTVADLCLKMPEGKYVLVKDPNKVRFYVPSFVARFATLSHFERHVQNCSLTHYRADAGPASSLLTLMVSFCSQSFGCMPFLSRHSPEKKRTKARLPRKK